MTMEHSTLNRLAHRMADESMRKADVLATEAYKLHCLAKLQPWPENDLTRLNARQKTAKARQLRRMAGQFGRSLKNETGLGLRPKPVVTFR